jgi:putative salt-induced outer membrane protein YdiY
MPASLAAFALASALSAAVPEDGTRLPDSLSALLAAAYETGDPEVFSQAVRLISLTHDAEMVAAAAGDLSPDSAAAARAALGLELMAPEAMADTAPAEAPAEEVDGPASMPGQALAFLANGRLENWSGRVRAGVRHDSGNVDRNDYSLGLEVTRALAGWGFEGAIDYNFSEVNGRTGRDELLTRARGERERGDRWTNFLDARYERDRLSGFEWKAFLGGGVGYRVYARDDLSWTLRAAPGLRRSRLVSGETNMFGALDLASDFQTSLTDTMRFTANTNLLLTDGAQADQTLSLATALGAVWSLELRYRYRYQFEPEPGFTNADSRADFSIVREF